MSDPANASLKKGHDYLLDYLGSAPDVTEASPDFTKISVGHIFGEIWTRPGLERRDRSLITIAAMIVLGRVPEMTYHMRGARRLGVTLEQLEEICLHLGYYAGFPPANVAINVARSIFAEADPG